MPVKALLLEPHDIRACSCLGTLSLPLYPSVHTSQFRVKVSSCAERVRIAVACHVRQEKTGLT